MSKKLTEGQRKARSAVRAAARKVIQELDRSDWRKGCVEFNAHFHLECWRYDKGVAFGQPIKCGMPIYAPVWVR